MSKISESVKLLTQRHSLKNVYCFRKFLSGYTEVGFSLVLASLMVKLTL